MKWSEFEEKQEKLLAKVERPPFKSIVVHLDGTVSLWATSSEDDCTFYKSELLAVADWIYRVYGENDE